jgi:trimethylguanosine synthase
VCTDYETGKGMYDLRTMIPLDGLKVFEAALTVTENIAYFVPRSADADQLSSLAGPGGR